MTHANDIITMAVKMKKPNRRAALDILRNNSTGRTIIGTPNIYGGQNFK